jgi:hypothetical protein
LMSGNMHICCAAEKQGTFFTLHTRLHLARKPIFCKSVQHNKKPCTGDFVTCAGLFFGKGG